MRLTKMTLEQLEDLEEELKTREEEPSMTIIKIEVYEAIHAKLVELVKEDKTYQDYLDYVKKKLVFFYIQYGTYLKSSSEKSSIEANRNLRKALKYDKRNPIASYRLGFLTYKEKNYLLALIHLQNAIDSQTSYADQTFLLSSQQLMNAQLYLTNSALHIAKKSFDNMNKNTKEIPSQLQNYEFSMLYDQLQQNERYLENQAFVKITQDGVSYCSKEACDNIMRQQIENTILLYFNDRNIRLLFNDDDDPIVASRADILRHLLTKSTKDKPANSFDMQNYFVDANIRGLASNTFISAITRLRRDLSNRDIPDVIHPETRNNRQRPAYYYDRSLPFIVMYRVDEVLNS